MSKNKARLDRVVRLQSKTDKYALMVEVSETCQWDLCAIKTDTRLSYQLITVTIALPYGRVTVTVMGLFYGQHCIIVWLCVEFTDLEYYMRATNVMFIYYCHFYNTCNIIDQNVTICLFRLFYHIYYISIVF